MILGYTGPLFVFPYKTRQHVLMPNTDPPRNAAARRSSRADIVHDHAQVKRLL